MGWWSAERQTYAFNRLLAGGLTPHGAAALVSRWANVESTGDGPFAVNPSSGAFGIAQWLGSRLPPIRGNTDFDAQLAYVLLELNSSEARAGSILRSATNASDAAIGASIYERAEGYNNSTGRDNFTARTASGIPGVLSLAGGVADNGDGYTEPGAFFPGENQFDFSFNDLSGLAGLTSSLPTPVLVGGLALAGFLIARRLDLI